MLKRAIAPKWIPLIRELMQNGATHEQVHARLLEEGVQCSLATVGRRMKELSDEHNFVARRVYAEAVAKTAGSDVTIINQTIEDLIALRMQALKANDVGQYKMLCTEIQRWVQMRVNLSGSDAQRMFQDDDDVGDEVMVKLRSVGKEAGDSKAN